MFGVRGGGEGNVGAGMLLGSSRFRLVLVRLVSVDSCSGAEPRSWFRSSATNEADAASPIRPEAPNDSGLICCVAFAGSSESSLATD